MRKGKKRFVISQASAVQVGIKVGGVADIVAVSLHPTDEILFPTEFRVDHEQGSRALVRPIE